MGKECGIMKNLKFFVRILPCDDFDWDNIKIEDNNKTIYIRCLRDLKLGQSNVDPYFWCFKTDGIFYNTSQEEVYENVMTGVLKGIHEGIDSVVISHGQTCSGKSFTMCALRSMYEYRGIVPRFIHDLFSDMNSKFQDWKVDVTFSFVEFHGNKITDLLRKSDQPVKMKEVTVVKARSEKHLLSLLFKGERRRDMEKSAWYLGAHRATTVITFHLECLSLLKSCALICRSKVHFVDLAGIETVGKRNLTSFKNAYEQGMANQCKSFLENLLIEFKGATKSVTDEYKIKRRSCAMLQYLGPSVSPSCILRLIGHIRPTFSDLEVSLSTLKLGYRIKHIQPLIPKYNIVPHYTLLFRKFKEELESKNGTEDFLKKLLSEPSEMECGNISRERVEHLERLLQAYMDGKVTELSVIGNAEMTLILQILRNLYLKKVEAMENLAVKEAVASRKKSNRSTTGSLRGSDLSNSKFDSVKPASLLHKNKRAGSKHKSEHLKEKIVDTPLVAVAEEPNPIRSDEIPSLTKQDIFRDSVIPSPVNSELWSDFVIENGTTAEHLNNLAESTRKKRLLLEIASAEYSEIRSKLEKLRLQLKLSTIKRKKILTSHENRPCEHEKEYNKQDLDVLENESKCSKELLEMKFNDWVDAAKEFMEEKYLFREKFEKYCKCVLTYQHPNLERKIERKAMEVSSSKEEETAREYFYSLQKRLRK